MNPIEKWIPPRGLERSRPREVALTSSGWTLVIFALLLLVGALPAGIAFGLKSERDNEIRRRLAEEGKPAEARITRLWRERNDSKQPYVTYELEWTGRKLTGKAKVPKAVFPKLSTSGTLPVLVVDGEQPLHYPAGWSRSALPIALAGLVPIGMAAIGLGMLFILRRDRRVLEYARVAPGTVLKVKKSHDGQSVEYEFRTLGGRRMTGRATGKHQTGAVVTVLYDADDPSRNRLYPLVTVSLRRH